MGGRSSHRTTRFSRYSERTPSRRQTKYASEFPLGTGSNFCVLPRGRSVLPVFSQHRPRHVFHFRVCGQAKEERSTLQLDPPGVHCMPCAAGVNACPACVNATDEITSLWMPRRSVVRPEEEHGDPAAPTDVQITCSARPSVHNSLCERSLAT